MPLILDTENLSCYIFDRVDKNLTHSYSKVRNKFNPEILKAVKNNQQIALDKLQGENIIILTQIHGNEVVDADNIVDFNFEETGDSIVTTKAGLVIGIYTADCVPVLFYSHDNKVIGAAHCGWKSAKLDIIDKVIQLMISKGATEIRAIIGPAIQQSSYEIGPEFHQDFIKEDLAYQQFFINSGKADHYMFDLPAFVSLKLKNAGVTIINNLGEDTYANPEKYPSYRRSQHGGEKYKENILSTIMIKQ